MPFKPAWALAGLAKQLKGRKCGDDLIDLLISYSGHGRHLCQLCSPEGIIVLDPTYKQLLRTARITHPQVPKAFDIEL